MCSIANNRVLQQQPQVLLNPPSAPVQVAPVASAPSAAGTIQDTIEKLTAAIGPTRESLLRDKAVFPRGLKQDFGRRGGIDAGMLRELTAIREARSQRNPVENKLVENQTSDPSADNYLILEAGSTLVDFAVDLVPIITGDPTGVEAFRGDFVGAFVGAVPEIYLLVAKCREISSGKVRFAMAIETVQSLDGLSKQLQAFCEQNQGRLSDSEQQKLEDLASKISKFKDGLEATLQLNTQIINEARTERKHILVGFAGGAVELGSAAALTVGEHATNAALTTTGASLGLVAAPLSIYFTGKMIKEELENTNTYRENQTAALTALENHPGYRMNSSAGETESLTRALSKMAAERSTVKESRFKTVLFATGFLGTLASTVGSGLLLGGASTAAAVTAVGFAATGLGIAAFLGFVGYGVYKLATSKASSTKELQKAAFHGDGAGNPPKKLLELARIQSLKAKNDITSIVIRERLRVALPRIPDDVDKKSVLKSELEKLGGTFAGELAERILENLPSQAEIDASFQLQQNPYDPDPDFQPRSRAEVSQSLLERSLDRTLESFIASKNKAHVSLLDSQEWATMISDEIAAGSSQKLDEALHHALPVPCELPCPEAVIQAVRGCKPKFRQIGVEANATDSMRRILAEEFRGTYSAETADRLAGVVTTNLFSHIDGVESLYDLDRLLEGSNDLKKNIATSNTAAFEESLRNSSVEMGKLAAARKLLRRDPEMLLYTVIDAIQRADQEGRTPDSDKLKEELYRYGASPEILATALKAESINQRLDAAALLAKSLNFL